MEGTSVRIVPVLKGRGEVIRLSSGLFYPFNKRRKRKRSDKYQDIKEVESNGDNEKIFG